MTHTPPAIPIAIRPNEVDNNEVEVEWRQAADQNCFLLTVFNAPLVLLLLQLLRLDLDLDLIKILKIFTSAIITNAAYSTSTFYSATT